MDISRHEKILNPADVTTPCHIIGVGATGSWLALELFKMGIRDIRIYDFDKVEAHNLPNQLYREIDIGKFKVDAMVGIFASFGINQVFADNEKQQSTCTFNDVQKVVAVKEKITKDNFTTYIQGGYVFCLVDSMSARAEIFDLCKYNIGFKAFIETRIGTDSLRVYRIKPCIHTQIEKFEDTLYSDEEAEESFCGTPQTIVATSVTAASLAVWKFIESVNACGEKDIANEIIMDVKTGQTLTSYWSE